MFLTLDTDSYTQSLAAKSIKKVKNDLQTVIDLMGPNTPQFLQSPSNDGDNELSSTSETENKSSVSQHNITAKRKLTLPCTFYIFENIFENMKEFFKATEADFVNEYVQKVSASKLLSSPNFCLFWDDQFSKINSRF